MLRLVIGTGVLLMLAGFGAAGWQYWTAPAPVASDSAAGAIAVPVAEGASAPGTLLISASGGLVDPATARAFLMQDRHVPGRTATVTLGARLADLLAEGEKLPEAAYFQVLADIRAPELGKDLCAALVAAEVSDCAVNRARVIDGSVDPLAGTAVFDLELVFRARAPLPELPDLAQHILIEQALSVELPPNDPGNQSASAALAAAAGAARAACATTGLADHCRINALQVDWMPGQPARLSARIAWLAPLPQGMFPAPALPPSGG